MSPLAGQDIYDPQTTDTATEPGEGPRYGKLTRGSEQEKAATALSIWRSKDTIFSRKEAQWRVNELRRSGQKAVQLRRTSDGWKAWVPPHVEKNPDLLHSMNAAANQCRKFAAIMLADPPVAEAVPVSGEDEDRDAAEFTTRALRDIQSSGKLNDQRLIRRAFDKASTFGSGYIWYYVDSKAGGRQPVEVSAGFDPETGLAARSTDELIENPDTGEPWPAFREMYVTEDDDLTDDPAEARTDWVSEIRGTVLTGRNVRMIPHTATHINEASGVQILLCETLGELKRRYDSVREMNEEELEDILSFRPARSEWLLTTEQLRVLNSPPDDDNERPVFVLVTYMLPDDGMLDGLCLVTAGEGTVLDESDWIGRDDEGRTFQLPLPVTQYPQWAEGDDDPNHHGLMDNLGPGNEIRARVINDWLTHMSRLNNRKIFLPYHSTVSERELGLPGHTVVRMNPGGQPEYEQIPAFSAGGHRLIDFATREMQNASSLTDVAQGLESPQVQSGRHAQAIMSQVHASLSDIRQNIIDGFERGCRIQIALIRAFYRRERRISWVGEDGAYKERRWSGTSFRGTSDVRLKNGTLTMLTPVAKAQLAEHLFSLGVIDNLELREMTSANMGPIVGLQDDPFVARIRRQIARWQEGPPSDWAPQFEQITVTDPRTGQPEVRQEQIMDPVLAGIFRPYPQDDLPHVALTRLREISKAMSKTSFAVQPPVWQFGLIEEFERALAAGQGTPGPQPGQPPINQVSPAQRTQGPLAPPDTPVPTEVPGGAGPAAAPIQP